MRERCRGVEGGGVAARNSRRAAEDVGLVKERDCEWSLFEVETAILEEWRVGTVEDGLDVGLDVGLVRGDKDISVDWRGEV